ncbi:DUF6059 family protein [Streptomyces sp. NPDC057474]|uniref:DUF6059 family protein n=1 Tax=Streptomyces sp. NPDC057474 TaxID=3346144 RepID=UPI0036B7D083
MTERRRWPSHLLRHVWAGLVALGGMYVCGEVRRARAPQVLLSRPPAGHPERLCPQVPLSPLERALTRELSGR